MSVGVHGDETGPIEVLAHVLDALAQHPGALAVNLMVCVGNIDAIAAGKRFIDADLNRMFRPVRGSLASAAEAVRADAMIAATDAFFAGAGPVRWHLDLHTAIRPSVKSRPTTRSCSARAASYASRSGASAACTAARASV